MATHKKLKQYTVVAEGKSSRIIAFSKKEAEVYVKNFIECRLSHSYVKQTGATKNLTTYFSDNKLMKSQLLGQILLLQLVFGGAKSNKNNINKPKQTKKMAKGTREADEGTVLYTNRDFLLDAGVSEKKINELEKEGGEEALAEHSEKIIEKIEEADSSFETAKISIDSVDDDSDFNKENIDDAKNKSYSPLQDLLELGVETVSCPIQEEPIDIPYDESTATSLAISIPSETRKLSNRLNKMRKFQFDLFEEEFSAEIYSGSYHEYKYAKTIAELCDLVTTAIKSLGADIKLDPAKYRIDKATNEIVRDATEEEINEKTESEETPKINIEEDIKKALTDNNVSFNRIDVDWHDKDYDPGEDEAFSY